MAAGLRAVVPDLDGCHLAAWSDAGINIYDLVHSAQLPVQSSRQSGSEGDVPQSISQV